MFKIEAVKNLTFAEAETLANLVKIVYKGDLRPNTCLGIHRFYLRDNKKYIYFDGFIFYNENTDSYEETSSLLFSSDNKCIVNGFPDIIEKPLESLIKNPLPRDIKLELCKFIATGQRVSRLNRILLLDSIYLSLIAGKDLNIFYNTNDLAMRLEFLYLVYLDQLYPHLH